MDYTALTREQQVALTKQALTDLEQKHFMARILADINSTLPAAKEAHRRYQQELVGYVEAIRVLKERYAEFLELPKEEVKE